MYARLLLESLRRGTRRKLLAVSAVALGTLGATALAEVMLASGDRLAAEMGSYGANLEVVPAREGETLPVGELAVVRKIFWRNNIVAVAPLHSLRVRWEPGEPGEIVAPLVGTWFDHPLEPDWRTGLPRTRPTLKIEGRWPRESGESEVVLGRRLAERLGRGAGDELRVRLGQRSLALRVVGVVTSGGEEDEEAFAPLAAVEGLADQPGRFTRAEVFALTAPEGRNPHPDPHRMSTEEYETWYCTAYPSSIAFQLNQALPGARTSVVSGVTAATADVLLRLRGILGALATVALLGAAVGVTAAMTATVMERRLEAGLLIAIGAARSRVVFFFLSEAALLGVLGGLAGGALGLGAGRLLGSGALGVAVPWIPALLPFAALLGLVLAVLASLAPVARALERYPADILKRATA
ncbi:MAG: putative transport system permease protein [Acidobacteriota bacterium]|jgi:putative ABC transport system permease protein|nr:putative transport system permease protein [Acidobacteriota bacterium]